MKIQKYHWKYIFFHHQMLRIFIHYDDLKINWQNFETDAWMHDFLGSVRQLDWKLILWGVYIAKDGMDRWWKKLWAASWLTDSSLPNAPHPKCWFSKPKLSSMQKKRRNEPLMPKEEIMSCIMIDRFLLAEVYLFCWHHTNPQLNISLANSCSVYSLRPNLNLELKLKATVSKFAEKFW